MTTTQPGNSENYKPNENSTLYRISSDDEAFSPVSDDDKTYQPPPKKQRKICNIANSSSSSDSESNSNKKANIASPSNENAPMRRKRGGKSKFAVTQDLRNSGQEYKSTSKTQKMMPARKIGPPCGLKCRLKCPQKVSEEVREKIFRSYWNMKSLQRQRDFIARSLNIVEPRYQYRKPDSNRKPKHSFNFDVENSRIRVCKIFFKNTLGINDRPIRTVIDKIDTNGFLQQENRGKHKKQVKVSDDSKQRVKEHINSIPRIESHYLRKQTTREYIDGGKNLTDLYKDYKSDCIKNNLPFVQKHTYRKIFKNDFNISFFVPKKDQCDLCTSYKIAEESVKKEIEENYTRHIQEKEESREEKRKDKELVSDTYIVACYDLQAVMTIPKGEISTFYYKSKINCLNFTISELGLDHTECYFWDEGEAQRGANEIGTCVLTFLQKKSEAANSDLLDAVFYSDNCCGQQKNQFIISMYIYAVVNLKFKSITHKFLIRGHTQNEGDAVHSIIEKEIKKTLRSGPIYVPFQYITAIRNSKKNGNPFVVNEMTYEDFIDIKNLAGVKLIKNLEGDTVKLSDIKVIRIEKGELNDIKIFYKTSYFQNYKEFSLQRNFSRYCDTQQLKPLYKNRVGISERKKNDIRSLISANLIPKYYQSYYEGIFKE